MIERSLGPSDPNLRAYDRGGRTINDTLRAPNEIGNVGERLGISGHDSAFRRAGEASFAVSYNELKSLHRSN